MFLLGLVAIATVFTACEKDEVDALDARLDKVEGFNVSAQSQIDELVSALAESTSQLQSAIDANASNIEVNAADIIAANEAIAQNLELIGQVSSTLSSELSDVYGTLEATELDLTVALAAAIEALEDADASTNSSIAAQVALLRSEIDAALEAANAYADANDAVGSFNPSGLQDAINTVSANLAAFEVVSLERDQLLEAAINSVNVARSNGDLQLHARLTDAIASLEALIAAESTAREAGDADALSTIDLEISALSNAITLLSQEGDEEVKDLLEEAVGIINDAIAYQAADLSFEIDALFIRLVTVVSNMQLNDANARADLQEAIDALQAEVDAIVTLSEASISGSVLTLTYSDGNDYEYQLPAGTGTGSITTIQGPQGNDGSDGDDGAPGTPGTDGQDGADGTSVTIVSSNKVNGVTTITFSDGTVISIADGVDGQDGQDGAPGQDGEDGEDGAPGADGQDGQDGQDGGTTVVTDTASDTLAFGDWVLGTQTGGVVTTATAASDVEFVTESTTAVVRVDTRDYTVTVNGIADVPAPVAAASDLTRTVTVSAASSRQVSNPAYVAPNGADTYTYSAWTPATAASDVEFIDQTRTATLNVVDAADVPAPVAEATTRTISNPNYQAPVVTTPVSVTITIINPGLLNGGRTFTINGNSVANGGTISVSAGDVIAFAWTGGEGAGSLSYTVTEADVAADFGLTFNIPFSSVSKS